MTKTSWLYQRIVEKHVSLSKIFYGKLYLTDLFTPRVERLKELEHFSLLEMYALL
jgi:hypothetical protein